VFLETLSERLCHPGSTALGDVILHYPALCAFGSRGARSPPWYFRSHRMHHYLWRWQSWRRL